MVRWCSTFRAWPRLSLAGGRHANVARRALSCPLAWKSPHPHPLRLTRAPASVRAAGLKDGVPVGEPDATHLVDIICGGLGAAKEEVRACLADRPQRAAAYLVAP